MHLSIRQDRSKTIREAFRDIQITMLITLVLVVGVIFLFLHNGSATLIPALALPFSILGTFAVMRMLDYSLDNLSMMALILSIGFVVDDAIVMLENIVRHMEAGETPLEAALKGSKEIGFTILTMTTSLAAVFIPILFMAGILGRLFREFAVTITTAILISGVVSVTLTPMLCSRFLKVVHAKTGLCRADGPRRSTRCSAATRWSLGWSCATGWRCSVSFVVVLWATVHMFGVVPEGIHPGCRQRLAERQPARRAGHVVLRDGRLRRDASPTSSTQNPNIDAMMVNTGGGNAGGMNTGRINIQLTPRADAHADARRRLRSSCAGRSARFPAFRGVRERAAGAADWRLPGQQQLQPDGAEPEQRGALQVGARPRAGGRRSCPKCRTCRPTSRSRSPRVDLVIDRDKAAAVGLDASTDRQRAQHGPRARGGRPPSTARARSTACCSSSIRSTRSRPTR